jgi:hypothetical protein
MDQPLQQRVPCHTGTATTTSPIILTYYLNIDFVRIEIASHKINETTRPRKQSSTLTDNFSDTPFVSKQDFFNWNAPNKEKNSTTDNNNGSFLIPWLIGSHCYHCYGSRMYFGLPH